MTSATAIENLASTCLFAWTYTIRTYVYIYTYMCIYIFALTIAKQRRQSLLSLLWSSNTHRRNSHCLCVSRDMIVRGIVMFANLGCKQQGKKAKNPRQHQIALSVHPAERKDVGHESCLFCQSKVRNSFCLS